MLAASSSSTLTVVQALFLGLLQGASELFPVSSLGHAVIVPHLLHWAFNPTGAAYVPFLVLLHLGTALALLILFWREWFAIIAGFFRAAFRGSIRAPEERVAMLLVIGTIPAGVVGFFGQKPLEALFTSPRLAAIFLVVNGLMLLGAEVLRRRDERRAQVGGESRERQEATYRDLDQLSFRAALFVGLAQSLALLPGISRSGATMAGGLVAGLRHQEAAHFAFLLATPIIAGAALLEVPQLFSGSVPLAEYLAAAVLAGLAAYASGRFLIRYFRVGRLDPYGYYCLALGIISLALLTFSK